jgi:phage-related protein
MADIGSATVRVTPNMTGIQSKIAAGFKGSAGPATAALGDEVEKNSGPFQAALGKLGGFAKAGGIAIAAGMAAGAVGLATLTTKALQSGAELEQQLGGAEAVFGEYAAQIKAKANDAYTNAGLSQNEFLQGANKMGSLFQGAGFSVQQSMQMSADSMQRASDVASIMGIDTTAALEAVAGMAKGNFTMMDNLGVAMNDTSIQAYALSKGINKSTSEMTAQEKIGLAQQMFMEKTAKYAGNYAKENDTLAGSINTTKKAFEDFMGTGNVTGFVESLVNTIKIAVPQIISLLPKLVDGIVQIVQAIVPALSAALPTLIPALINAVVSLIQALVAAMPTIIQALLAALPLLINGFIQLFLAIVKALPAIVTMVANALPTVIDAIVKGLTTPEAITAIIMGAIQLLMAIILAIPTIITALVKALPEIQRAILTTLTSKAFIDQLLGAGVQFMKSMISGIAGMYGQIASSIGYVVQTIGQILSPSNMARIGGDLVKGLWNGISNLTDWVLGKIKGFGKSVMDGIKGFFGIHSPSTEWAWIGKMDVMGLAKGITGNAGLVTKAVDKLATDAMAGMTIAPAMAGMNVSPIDPAGVNGSGIAANGGITQNNNIYNQVDLESVSRELAWQVRR